MRMRVIACGLLATALLVAAPACGPKTDVNVPGLPALDPAALDKDVRAGSIKVLAILEASGVLVTRASRFEEQLVAAGAVPPNLHEQYRKGVEALKARALKAIDDIEHGAITKWADLKVRIDPILQDVNNLTTIARSFSAGVNRDNLLEFIASISEVISGALPKNQPPALQPAA